MHGIVVITKSGSKRPARPSLQSLRGALAGKKFKEADRAPG
jgi:hypothetical protein